MSYRYNTIDIIVGIGMCAIVFGALLFVFAANGTYQATTPQFISVEQPDDIEFGMNSLQSALGQAIVEQVTFERHANQALARAVSEWNLATSLTKSSNRSQAVRWEPSCVSLRQSLPTTWPGSRLSWDVRL